MRLALSVILLALSLSADPAAGPQTLQAANPVDKDRLEAVEDLTESLANELLELSMATQRRDPDRIGGYFSEKLQASPSDDLPGDAALCYADPTRAASALGWKATRRLDEMCADSWRWQSQNPDGYA